MGLNAVSSADGNGDVVVKDCCSVWIQEQWLLEKVIEEVFGNSSFAYFV
jgi:hypothetical protein